MSDLGQSLWSANQSKVVIFWYWGFGGSVYHVHLYKFKLRFRLYLNVALCPDVMCTCLPYVICTIITKRSRQCMQHAHLLPIAPFMNLVPLKKERRWTIYETRSQENNIYSHWNQKDRTRHVEEDGVLHWCLTFPKRRKTRINSCVQLIYR
jgi:hypothetical protein